MKEKSKQSFHYENESGKVKITEYAIFPGIWLAYKEAHIHYFENRSGFPDTLLEITHCKEGRLEYEGVEQFFYLGKGDVAIHCSSYDKAMMHCPTGEYQGISVMIHPEKAPRCTSCLLSDVNVELPEIYRKFCLEEQLFIMRSTPRLEHIFSELYTVPETIRRGYLKVKVLELLLFLSCLEPRRSQIEKHMCTKNQVTLTRRLLALVNEHRDKRLTATEMAKELQVPVDQLRKSMAGVYGMPLYQCVRTYKMHLAAIMLEETNRTIMDIAGELGYDNSSKFAGAFKAVVGVSPAEYRQKTQKQLHFGAKLNRFGADESGGNMYNEFCTTVSEN